MLGGNHFVAALRQVDPDRYVTSNEALSEFKQAINQLVLSLFFLNTKFQVSSYFLLLHRDQVGKQIVGFVMGWLICHFTPEVGNEKVTHTQDIHYFFTQ